MMKRNNIKTVGVVSGWFGMVLIQSATLPVTIKNIMGMGTSMPPIEMVLLIWTGLLLFLVRAAINKDTLYIVSNSIGFFLNGILLALIVFK